MQNSFKIYQIIKMNMSLIKKKDSKTSEMRTFLNSLKSLKKEESDITEINIINRRYVEI